jgi:hypothetical protein
VSIAAGLKDIKFGTIAMFLDDSYYLLQATAAFGNSSVAVGTFKQNENKVPDGDDRDAYYVLAATKAIPSVNLSALWITEVDDTISSDYAPWTVEGYYQGGTLNEDVDLAAYAVAGGLGMSAAGADFGVLALYGSGEGDNDSDAEAFIPYPAVNTGDQVDLIVIDDLSGNSVANRWAVAVNGTIKPVANLSIKGQVGFYNTVEDVNDENYVGTEVDLTIKYKINDFLGWKLAAGYLFAGDVLEALGDDDDLFEVNNEFMVTF